MYTITTDLDRGRVDVTIDGFWSIGDLTAFARDIVAATDKVLATGQVPVTFCDYSRSAIQSREVVAGFQKFLSSPAIRSRRIAMYTGGMLARMQAMRVTSANPVFRLFTDRDEAERWLMAAVDTAAAA